MHAPGLLTCSSHRYYQEGFTEGALDGEKAGLDEGRLFGLQKGFEKFVEAGRIQGRVAVWKARIPRNGTTPSGAITNLRVVKHIQQLETIMSHLSTKNDEEDVEDVDESLKRARAKMKIICNMLGEKESKRSAGGATDAGGGEPNIEEGLLDKNVRR